MVAPLPEHESERLAALYEHDILDTEPDEAFDDFTRLAAHICGTPIAAVSLVDAHRQWFKSILGLDTRETSRDVAFCAHTILQPDLMIVPDSREDPRFADNPFVTDEAQIRFYAGAPLMTEDGFSLGSLCVLDRVPRSLSAEQENALRTLSRRVSNHLADARRVADRERLLTEKERLAEEREALFAERRRVEAEQRESHRALAESEARLKAVLEDAPIILYATDANGIVTLSEGTGLSVLGMKPGEAVGRSAFSFRSSVKTEAHTRRALAGEAVSYDIQVDELYLHVSLRPIRTADGSLTGIIGVCFDITERKRAEEELRDHAIVLQYQNGELEKANAQLEALATTDGLTGLRNHRAFQERLAEEVSRADRYGTPLSLVLLDVDHFKRYNDAYGHPAGDIVIQTVARILEACAREADLVARYGGEEFVLILPQTDLEGAVVQAERVRAAIESHVWPVRAVTASLGAAMLLPGESGAHLIARSDAALYQSKAAGRNNVTRASQERLPPAPKF